MVSRLAIENLSFKGMGVSLEKGVAQFMSERARITLGGQEYDVLGKGAYDAIIFGLGFRECLLASLLIKEKKKVGYS